MTDDEQERISLNLSGKIADLIEAELKGVGRLPPDASRALIQLIIHSLLEDSSEVDWGDSEAGEMCRNLVEKTADLIDAELLDGNFSPADVRGILELVDFDLTGLLEMDWANTLSEISMGKKTVSYRNSE